MSEGITLFALVVIVFVGLSARIGRAYLTAPILFMLAGVVVGAASDRLTIDGPTIRVVAELTLALLLFHDAEQLTPRDLRADWSITGRLLLVGLPLTIVSGFVVARLLFPDIDVWLALLLAAALSPTDSGLATATVLDRAVPARTRRVLKVESGLNDGLVTPVVFFAIASAAGVSDGSANGSSPGALLAIVVGVVLGGLAGLLSGRLLSLAKERGWREERLVPMAVLVVPLLAYYGAGAVGGNGFTAAFVSGMAFAVGSRAGTARSDVVLTDMVSALLGCAAWMLFGAAVATRVDHLLQWQTFAFAALSLTVLRMLPVAVCLLGSGLRLPTVAYVGWFGPRGLPSVVFVLVAGETLRGDPGVSPVVAAIAATVILSVLAHGASAPPWSRRYGAWARRTAPVVEAEGDRQ